MAGTQTKSRMTGMSPTSLSNRAIGSGPSNCRCSSEVPLQVCWWLAPRLINMPLTPRTRRVFDISAAWAPWQNSKARLPAKQLLTHSCIRIIRPAFFLFLSFSSSSIVCEWLHDVWRTNVMSQQVWKFMRWMTDDQKLLCIARTAISFSVLIHSYSVTVRNDNSI